MSLVYKCRRNTPQCLNEHATCVRRNQRICSYSITRRRLQYDDVLQTQNECTGGQIPVLQQKQQQQQQGQQMMWTLKEAADIQHMSACVYASIRCNCSKEKFISLNWIIGREQHSHVHRQTLVHSVDKGNIGTATSAHANGRMSALENLRK